ncbi:hypothetical protein HanXRQr2_Chr05g0195501 [Helianthus annuus]|uniref:Uncharacterized protein n=1 Tax=Helianthus annuus TaxID=4232 RepID=A0A9K3IX57_HELAN|nr:hypothetical protein HanXRQr2_Chr05g0195501 [Helianthus annuus]KAJ0921224.1 hypothetical protein HanPSC8_Chr05g0189051 [Helianthus annuus]
MSREGSDQYYHYFNWWQQTILGGTCGAATSRRQPTKSIVDTVIYGFTVNYGGLEFHLNSTVTQERSTVTLICIP